MEVVVSVRTGFLSCSASDTYPSELRSVFTEQEYKAGISRLNVRLSGAYRCLLIMSILLLILGLGSLAFVAVFLTNFLDFNPVLSSPMLLTVIGAGILVFLRVRSRRELRERLFVAADNINIEWLPKNVRVRLRECSSAHFELVIDIPGQGFPFSAPSSPYSQYGYQPPISYQQAVDSANQHPAHFQAPPLYPSAQYYPPTNSFSTPLSNTDYPAAHHSNTYQSPPPASALIVETQHDEVQESLSTPLLEKT
eukprot:TRINITY_DN8318_c0_g1_i1.p1 TRINITY_DN8318_c0_g1~~TRINITY_DN8318_c0_g1_i1.p1  ORF type:complete len:252 (-),score=24.73 TRINITY_DN8318_c0_g1_i1:54-809(-)